MEKLGLGAFSQSPKASPEAERLPFASLRQCPEAFKVSNFSQFRRVKSAAAIHVLSVELCTLLVACVPLAGESGCQL